jgi:hypothetical protein
MNTLICFGFFCKFVSNRTIMGFPELKNKVLLYIENADEQFLEIVSEIIDCQKKDDLLLKEAIEKAKLQVINEETISNKLVMEETRKRYPKYFKNEY